MKDSFKRIIIKGTFILTISNVIVSGLNYLSNSLSAKSLGPSGFGELSALFAYLNVFNIPLTVFTTLIIVKVGRSEKNRLKVAHEIEKLFKIKFVEKKLYVLIALFSILVVPYVTNLSFASSFVLYVLVFLSVLGTLYFALLQGLHLFSQFAIVLIIVSLARLLGTTASYFGYGGLYSIYAGIVSGGIIALIVSKKYIPRNGSERVFTSNIRIRDYILRKQTLITAISLLSVALLMNVDLMFVKRSFSPVEAGIYSSWSLLSRIIGYFTAPLLAVSLLFFSAKESVENRKNVLYFLMSSIVVIGSFILFVYQTFTSEVLLLIFSSKFLDIAPLAPYAALFGMLVTIIALVTNYHIANNNYASLITPVIIPMHIVLLIVFGISLENIIAINVASAFLTAGMLVVSLLHTS